MLLLSMGAGLLNYSVIKRTLTGGFKDETV
jgi:hypothetical protein